MNPNHKERTEHVPMDFSHLSSQFFEEDKSQILF